MARALALAARAGGRTSPNPNVGAVALDERRGIRLAEGFHRAYGAAHAEAALVKDAARRRLDLRGSTLVCTLEPCAHQGRTPPCAPIVAAAGFARVVVALRDPNPAVDGRGIELLRRHGIEVVEGPGAKPARRLLEGFRHWLRTGRPFVHLKMAILPDGTVYRGRGRRREISGETSRRIVQSWRHLSPAVLVGAGTVRTDDPQLTVRDLPPEVEAEPWQPRRIVLASRFDVPVDARMLAPNEEGPPPLVVGAETARPGFESALQAAGVETLRVRSDSTGLDLGSVLTRLGDMGITSILVEGGPRLANAFLRQGLVNRLSVFIAGAADSTGESTAGGGERASRSIGAVRWEPPGGIPSLSRDLREREEIAAGPDRLVTGLFDASETVRATAPTGARARSD
jgi:diaminohydroxyphosphoribosylaminopyrimidine deaminase/5-amino-6-(5-phosphoribosylamino)uracil reductase